MPLMPTAATPTGAPATPYGAEFPLLTLHPVADASHRWAAILMESAQPLPASELFACAEHWLSAWGLRETLGKLPLILPEMPLDQLAQLGDATPTLPVLFGGPTRLRATAPDAADSAVAASVDAALSPYSSGLRVLLGAGEINGDALRCVQGRALPWTHTPAPTAHGPHLALAVRSTVDFTAAQTAGWHWVSGNYGLHPDPAVMLKSASGRSVLLKLLAQITQDADDSDIERTLKQDSNLSYQLLRLVNSVAFSLRNPITSFAQAIVLLGRRQLQRWLQLLLYAQQGNGAPHPLTPVAAWRAGLMETSANALGLSGADQEAAFMVGMFSRLDVLLAQPMQAILAPLGLGADVSAALLERKGKLGALLNLVDAAEAMADGAANGTTDAPAQLQAALALVGLDHQQWALAQGQSLRWAIQISRDL